MFKIKLWYFYLFSIIYDMYEVPKTVIIALILKII